MRSGIQGKISCLGWVSVNTKLLHHEKTDVQIVEGVTRSHRATALLTPRRPVARLVHVEPCLSLQTWRQSSRLHAKEVSKHSAGQKTQEGT